MLTKGELDALLEAYRLLATVLSSRTATAVERDLTVAVRALERAYSVATT